jgi:hypothetical protein
MNKIAFLYLTIDNPNKTIDYLIKNKNNIYIHPKNEIDKKYEKYIINKVIDTNWGTWSLIEATINLLKSALKNVDNDYFILCSGDSYLLRKKFDYHGLSCFDFVKKQDNYYKSAQWWILNKQDAIIIVKTINKYKYLKNIKFDGAIDEYYFLTVLMNENKNYKYNQFESIYKRWFKIAITKHPVIFNKVTAYDLQDIKKENSIFIRKVLPTFKLKEYQVRKELYVLLIGTDSINLDYFINNNVDLIIFSCIDIKDIDKRLLDKCICIFQIIFKFYYLCILDLYINYKDYLKQWTNVYFINETFKFDKIKILDKLVELPIKNEYNKKIFYTIFDKNNKSYFLKFSK